MNDSEMLNRCESAKSYRVKRSRLLTPVQRMDAFIALQDQAMQTLASNPQALAAFHRRNHHRRRQSNLQRLEALIRQPAVFRDDD